MSAETKHFIVVSNYILVPLNTPDDENFELRGDGFEVECCLFCGGMCKYSMHC